MVGKGGSEGIRVLYRKTDRAVRLHRRQSLPASFAADLQDGTTMVDRDHVIRACSMLYPVMERVAREWLQYNRKQVILAAGETETVLQGVDLDQRRLLCPGV